MALTSVLCYYMTSFNYGEKKARDAGLTCRYYLSNIIPDSTFYDSMRYEITFLKKRDNHFLFESEDSRVVISLTGFFIHVCQYNLLARTLRHDFSTTLNQSYVILITFISMTYQSEGSVSSI